MPIDLKSLEHLAQFSSYINGCPEHIRPLLISQEMKQRKELPQPAPRYPEIEMRWLYFYLKSLEETNSNKVVAYTTAAYYCQRVILDFATEHLDKTKDKVALQKLMEQQKELIFNHCLSEAIDVYLKGYQKGKDFSAQDILKNALIRFHHTMYREALYEFETISLIERQHFLQVKKEYEQRDLVTGCMTISTSINPELNFIQTRLKQENLSDFKLYGTSSLFFELAGLTQFSLDELQKPLSEFFADKGEQNIDDRVSDPSFSSGAGNNIKHRSFNEYFNNESMNTSCIGHMSQIQTDLDEFIKSIQIPQSKTQPVETEHKDLIALRNVVLKYRSVLKEIAENEKTIYTDRSTEALARRQHAIETLDILLAQVDTLNNSTKHIAKQLMKEVEANDPTWLELPLIDMILDFITLSAHVLYRHVMFKQPEQVSELYDAFEKLRDEPEEESDAESPNVV